MQTNLQYLLDGIDRNQKKLNISLSALSNICNNDEPFIEEKTREAYRLAVEVGFELQRMTEINNVITDELQELLVSQGMQHVKFDSYEWEPVPAEALGEGTSKDVPF